MTKTAMPAKRQADKKQPKRHKLGHPIILSAIGLTLLLLLVVVIIYPKNPFPSASHYSAETVTVAVQQQPLDNSNGNVNGNNNPGATTLLLSPASAQTTADPWLNGFGYRKPISISYSGTALSDYQVNVTPYIYNETGLVGSWHFSESGGRTTADSSGYGNTGLITNGANITTDGKFGNAMKFDGTDDFVSVPSSSALNPAAISVLLWVKTAVPDAGDTNYHMALVNPNGKYQIYVYPNGNLDFGNYVDTNLDVDVGNWGNAWHHIAVTQTEGTNNANIYFDGGLKLTGTLVRTGSTAGELTIGGRNTVTQMFNGTIDEVRIYNRTLSASEIQSLYNATKARLDYQDIRFTASNGATLLPFWMESDGKFWVKVPSIPTSGTTIYAYYGNPQATDAQNGTGTFVWFGDTLSKFTVTGNVVLTGDEFIITGTGAWNVNGFVSTTPLSRPIILEWTAKSDSNAEQGYVSALSVNTGASLTTGNVGDDRRTAAYLGAGYGFIGHGSTRYYNLKLVIPAAGYEYYANNTRYDTCSGACLSATDTNWYFESQIHTNGGKQTIKNTIRARKYAATEPSAVNGTEESLTTMSGGAQNWTWKVPTAGEYVRSGGAQDWNWKPFQQYLGRYRKPITVSGSGTALTDYQVNVTIINATGKMNANYTDIRFTDSDGTTLLPYWCENCTRTTNATFWVKVPSIPTTGTTIYAYYGNPSANDAQNGTGTFEFFGDTLDKWDTTGNVILDNGRIKITGNGAWNTNGILSKTTFTSPYVVETVWQTDTTKNHNGPIAISATLAFASNPGFWYYGHSDGDRYYYIDGSGGAVGGAYSTAESPLKLIIKGGNAYEMWWDNIQVKVGTWNPSTANKIASTGYGTYWLKNTRVRKYASTEPSAVNGTEEDSPIPQNITVPVGSATNWTWYPS